MQIEAQVEDQTYRTRGGGPIVATCRSTVVAPARRDDARIRCPICNRTTLHAVLGARCPGCGGRVVGAVEV